MGKRATKIDKHLRVAQFVRMISNGCVNSQLLAHAEKEWGVKTTIGYQYIAEAREVIIADVDQDRKDVVAELMHTSKTVIQKALERGELNNAIGAMNLITRLGGLEPK
jgi:phosphoribosyl-ATP pyrophosphohydrolase